jgi:hypothetical protein
MTKQRRPVPIYTTDGDLEAFMVYPMIYNRSGEWIGFITVEREVYSVRGYYVGWLSDDPRILRKRSYNFNKPRLTPPPPPQKMLVPPSVPLAPMMSSLGYETVDVLLEEPEKMPTLDSGEFKEDMD